MNWITRFLCLAIIILVVGCNNDEDTITYTPNDFPSAEMELLNHFPETVYYEIFVRAFYDSTGDGIGDIQGMTSQLDYLEELGVEAIWLMPINPSPSYHGYDVTDYKDINPEYGTLDDFKLFLEEAHNRDIKVIMDLVVNHTSYDHEWFQDALMDETSPYRDWYIWAEEDTNRNARGDWGQNLWHGVEPNQYMSVFWERMPDLNFDHPPVRSKMIEIGEFWLDDVGVDGFRLDAAKHIFPGEQEKNLEWWAEFRSAMEDVKEDVLLVGEVWDIPQVTAPYLEDGLHSIFDFDLAENLLDAARRERGNRLISLIQRDLERYNRYSDEYIISTFLTNHDINRVMSELQGNENRAKMAASLLLSLPGSPFVYYGEEIGMEGQKPDEHIREPMLWYEDPSEGGQTSWIQARHNLGENPPSVEKLKVDDTSLWRHYQTWIHLRRSQPALLYGDLQEAETGEQGIVAFIRETEDQQLLVIHNLTGEDKTLELKDEVNYLFFQENDDQSWDGEVLHISAYSTVIFE
ncbi:alpha-amylase family glycosyl hydrolase [Evansella tamaricis]|uniref:Alpha-amylase n=1 Tax=Evansella tamaricis TaxID=2069301 RepID=A0ABS6JMB3_9BACI|nr:alpha-amylase family glycosyl hydrolase [Evansella tamaricis]MBU9714820.1 alpha-amylase [Evansella tamaricis]